MRGPPVTASDTSQPTPHRLSPPRALSKCPTKAFSGPPSSEPPRDLCDLLLRQQSECGILRRSLTLVSTLSSGAVLVRNRISMDSQFTPSSHELGDGLANAAGAGASPFAPSDVAGSVIPSSVTTRRGSSSSLASRGSPMCPFTIGSASPPAR